MTNYFVVMDDRAWSDIQEAIVFENLGEIPKNEALKNLEKWKDKGGVLVSFEENEAGVRGEVIASSVQP